jgi:hypothetical protein
MIAVGALASHTLDARFLAMVRQKERHDGEQAKNAVSRQRGPYVSLAAICETTLQENAVITLVRVVDTFDVRGESDAMPPGVLAFRMVVALKSGEARGQRTMLLRLVRPSGDTEITESLKIELKGGIEGVTVVMPTRIVVTHEGVHWFDVVLNSRVLTRIPLRVRYHREKPPMKGRKKK